MATKKKPAPKKAAKKAPAKKPVAKKAVKKKSKAVKKSKPKVATAAQVKQATGSSPASAKPTAVAATSGKATKSRIRTRKSDGAQLILCPFWLPVGLKADLTKECGKTIWPSNYVAQAISEKLYRDNGKKTKR